MRQIAICDDFSGDRVELGRLLTEYYGREDEAFSVTEYEDGKQLLEDVQEEMRFHIIFLDIFMEPINGIQAAHEIRRWDENVRIVFTTTSSDFAVDSYEVYAVGYLLKPLQFSQMTKLLSRIEAGLEEQARRTLTIKTKDGFENIDYSKIVFVESQGRELFLKKTDGAVLRFYEKLNALEQRLDAPRFLRCHQSFLVNMDYIVRVEQDFVMASDDHVLIRSRQHKEIRDQYFRYLLQKNSGGRSA